MTTPILTTVAALFFLAAPAYAENADNFSRRLFEAQQQLALRDDAIAQYHLAEMYELGLGTSRDIRMALHWYGKSAEMGNTRAQQRVAALRDRSHNVPPPAALTPPPPAIKIDREVAPTIAPALSSKEPSRKPSTTQAPQPPTKDATRLREAIHARDSAEAELAEKSRRLEEVEERLRLQQEEMARLSKPSAVAAPAPTVTPVPVVPPAPNRPAPHPPALAPVRESPPKPVATAAPVLPTAIPVAVPVAAPLTVSAPAPVPSARTSQISELTRQKLHAETERLIAEKRKRIADIIKSDAKARSFDE